MDECEDAEDESFTRTEAGCCLKSTYIQGREGGFIPIPLKIL